MADRRIVTDLIANDRSSATFDKVARKSDSTGGKLKKFGAVVGAGFAVAGLAALKFGVDSVKAAEESAQSQARLEDAYSRFPKLADVNIESLRSLNSELALKTQFDDDAFAAGQATLAQFDLTGKQLQTMTPLLADYAAKTGKDLPTAAKTLGKAFLGNTRALKDLGVDVELTGNKAKDFAIIQDALSAKVGGFATKQGKTLSGRMAILRNQFGELQEKVGNAVLPILTRLAGWVISKGIPAISRLAHWVGPRLSAAVRVVRAVFAQFSQALRGNGETSRNLSQIAGRLREAWRHVQPVVSVLARVWFVSLRNQLRAVGIVMRTVVIPAVNTGLAIFNRLASIVESAVRRIRSAWNSLPSFDLPNIGIPGLASGGTVRRTGLAMVGERGPELVALPAGARVFDAGTTRRMGGAATAGRTVSAGGGIVVNVNGFVGSERALATEIRRVLRTADARFGTA